MSFPVAAVVLCAGKGTRMKSKRAKVLHPLLGKPLCFFPVQRALEAGASPVVAVVGNQAVEVEAALRAEFPRSPLLFALQREQKGTADAVKAARSALSDYQGTVLILYGDAPVITTATLQALLKAHRKAHGPLSLIATNHENPHGYGRVVRTAGKVVKVIEQKDCTPDQAKIRECNAGIYAVESEFLWESLSRIGSANAQGEYYLTDLVELAARKAEVAVVLAEASETSGVNDQVELAACAKQLRAQVNAAHMKAGVRMVDPETTYIDEGARIGEGCELGPMVQIGAGCAIGNEVKIGQGSVLVDSEVHDGTQIHPYSVLEGAQVGKGCTVGPFARLRPGTILAEGVHLGNFVETKKAQIGKGSKANHLSYLGDALIGEGVNVGAGTITCNYDGVNKHLTELGDGVFVGSDTQLVAPVKVGKGAYVGAGTTVTQDVPEMSLALSRAPQVIKEGWVLRKKVKGAGAKKVAGKTG